MVCIWIMTMGKKMKCQNIGEKQKKIRGQQGRHGINHADSSFIEESHQQGRDRCENLDGKVHIVVQQTVVPAVLHCLFQYKGQERVEG